MNSSIAKHPKTLSTPVAWVAGRDGAHMRDPLRRQLEGTLGYPFTDGNRIDVLHNGVEIFPAMLEAIHNAQRTIHFLTFVYWGGNIARHFATALADRAREGVEVFVLLDGFGAAKMDKGLVKHMRQSGVRVEWFRPLPRLSLWKDNHRTHRKILVCDGTVGFTGGVGIAGEWTGDARSPAEWRDTHFRVRGPAVRFLLAAFMGNWFETGASLEIDTMASPQPKRGSAAIQIVRSTASYGWNDTATMLEVLFSHARKRIWIASGYFLVDKRSQELLADAARRGVDVRVMFPGRYNDKRVAEWAGESTLEPMIDAGVAAFLYQKTMLHAKIILVDHSIAAVGSTNLNQRSLRKDEEVSMVIEHPPTVQLLSSHYQQDLQDCRSLKRRRWHHRGILQRMREAVTVPLHHNV